MTKIEELFRGFNPKSYKGIFIVGKNNKGKSLFLKDYSEGYKVLNIKELYSEFKKAQRDSFKENWYSYTIKTENLKIISENISNNIDIKYEQSSEEELLDFSIFKEFKINEDNIGYFDLTSTGYISLFLISSYLLYNSEKLSKENFLFLDEIDSYLDISNKQLLVNMLSKLLPNTKFVLATHSPFTIVKTKDYLIYNIETKNIVYTNDVGNFDGILKIMLSEYTDEYLISKNFEILKKIYFKIITDSYIKNKSEIDLSLKGFEILSFTYKEKILYNSIKNLIEKEQV